MYVLKAYGWDKGGEMMSHKVKDSTLAGQGQLKIEWAEQQMPVLLSIREGFFKNKTLGSVPLQLI
jgi:S-adenosylhomocysteine hydrolase